MCDELAGKTAIVTGASRGIGAATARELARLGVKVLCVARNTDETGRLVDEITAAGGAAAAMPCDVAVYADVQAVVEACGQQFGPVDILVNNAGVIDPVAHLADSDPEAWGKVADINFKGVYHGLRAALPVMVGSGGGTIVNISSGAATSPLEGWSHYCATKAGVLMLTRCAHAEYAERGVRVVGLSPGTVATDMQRVIKASGVNPVSRLDWSDHIPPEWPARAVSWLCTDAAADLGGTDFSIKTDEARRRVGLI